MRHLTVSHNYISSKCKAILGRYFFVIGVLCTVSVAALYPHLGCDECILKPKITSSWITVILLFLAQGIRTQTTALKKAILFWELSLFTHSFIFVYIPIITYLLSLFLRNYTSLNNELIDGLLILSALPTTTVSCVILTAASEGILCTSYINVSAQNFPYQLYTKLKEMKQLRLSMQL